MTTIYSVASSNKRKTLLILFFFVIFVITVSYFIGKALGYGLAFVGVWIIISGIMSFVSYYKSDSIVLAATGAKPATKEAYPHLYKAVENMAMAAGLPMPRVYVMNDPAPNAFATGRDPKHAVVCATTGILERLKDIELEGVIGHEMSHVKNYDTRLIGVVTILVGILTVLSNFFLQSMWFRGRDDERNNQIFQILALVAAILAPIAATLLQLAISRKREFLADADGALLTRYPDGLASALEKISQDPHLMKKASVSTAHLFIENPFKTDSGKKTSSWVVNLFSTHPPIEERIKILRSM
jgi:heat shock protein HtpX